MDIISRLNILYSSATQNNKKVAASSLFYIIQIKKSHSDYINYKQSLYLDIWHFISSYLKSIQNQDYGYDTINIKKITQAIESDDIIDEKIQLYNKTIHELEDFNFKLEAKKLKTFVKRAIISNLWHSKKFKNIVKSIIYSCCYNLWTVTGVLAFIFITYFLITLPFSNTHNSFFYIHYESYSQFFIVNHILNIVGDAFEYNEMNFCKPKCIMGFVIILIYKLLFTVFFAGLFMKYFNDTIKLNIYNYED